MIDTELAVVSLTWLALTVADLVLVARFPRFYASFGIPLKKTTVGTPRSEPIEVTRDSLQLAFYYSCKFWGADNAIWFRTRLGWFLLNKLGFLSITKGTFVREYNGFRCVHVMNMSTLLLILYVISGFLVIGRIELFGSVAALVFVSAILGISIYKNKQFDAMVTFLSTRQGDSKT